MAPVDLYVPVLRWKRGERWALAKVRDQDRAGILPLIELIPSLFDNSNRKVPRDTAATLLELLKRIRTAWGGRPVLLDMHHLPEGFSVSGISVWSATGALNKGLGLPIIPVCSLSDRPRDDDSHAAARSIGKGIALRLPLWELSSTELVALCRTWLNEVDFAPKEIDLILDAGLVTEDTRIDPAACVELTELAQWRSVTLLAGAFPKDLGGMAPGRQERPRSDLKWWMDRVAEIKMAGAINFGDYTVQHAIFDEPPPGATPSASIRYASEDRWVIMRGESLRRGAKGAQYPANAQLLCEQPEYSGAEYSEGDAYIHERANDPSRNGNPETWIRAGINRHITLTARQLATLRGV